MESSIREFAWQRKETDRMIRTSALETGKTTIDYMPVDADFKWKNNELLSI